MTTSSSVPKICVTRSVIHGKTFFYKIQIGLLLEDRKLNTGKICSTNYGNGKSRLYSISPLFTFSVATNGSSGFASTEQDRKYKLKISTPLTVEILCKRNDQLNKCLH
uniref:Uncharacterized protein n=1 Tax=Romanomermis culicivorax TaxID=13658 RepID=A0A915KCL0_ROMCU